MKHKSLTSIEKDVSVKIFPGSKITEKITLSPAKASYVICYGLASYFKSELDRELQFCEKFVVCFDEALNKIPLMSI